jgi:type I restriction enzyme S subunit
MAGEWHERKLGELTENFDSVRIPVKETDRRPGPYPYYGASGIVDSVDRYIFDGEYLLIAEDGENLRTRKTPVAFLARGQFWVNNHAHIVRGNAEADSRFLMYALAQTDIGGYLTGSTIPKLTQGSMNRIPIMAPPINEQRAIANILGALDDKIDLNRRMNETLGAMARALFTSWFEDFEPVRAKVEGREPNVASSLANLFPDSLSRTEFGEIPDGWRIAPLAEFCDINPARTLRKNELAPYIDMAAIPTRGHSPESWIERPYGSGARFENGDTLMARITPCLENGKTAYIDVLQQREVGWGSTEYIVLRPKAPLPNEYAYCLARSERFRDAAIRSMTGSSGRQRVPVEAVAAFKVAMPPASIAEAFGKIISPLFARMKRGASESRVLAEMRDALLPKLISGEIRVGGT